MYCVTSWGGANKTTLINLERAQRAVLKVSTFRPFRYPTSELLADCDVLSVRQLFILQTILKQHSLTPYDAALDKTKRRNYDVCRTEGFRTAHSHKYFCFLGAFLYNKLNAILSVHPMNKGDCKKIVQDWLKTKDYKQVEGFLKVVS